MDRHKIVILDYRGGKVHIFDYDKNIYSDGEDFFTEPDIQELDLCYDDCTYFITNDLQIKIH
jgi:hypothetical protein